MIRLFSYLTKLIVIFTIGNVIVLLLSFVAFLMWNKKYMELASNFVEKINSELKF